ncbi:hypothetical protein TGGT1_312970 [Toxoplasma gondii GT1]|uniref:C3H1-type domain-containing protein n=2 Tax=Toxoplasma gondii TaxID=5811 RepID=S7UTL4_TOXGG|nr:hypothetical protein TGGT1_312970 [Toxoplasma gondii GT1]KAF4639436.1 hypothetical protein TGRH88_052080 [Toxoplasma gondii]
MPVTKTYHLAQGCLGSAASKKRTEEPEPGRNRHEYTAKSLRLQKSDPEDQTTFLKGYSSDTNLKYRNEISLTLLDRGSERNILAVEENFPNRVCVSEECKESQVECVPLVRSPTNNPPFQAGEARNLPTLLSRGSSPGCVNVPCPQEAIALPPPRSSTSQSSVVSQHPISHEGDNSFSECSSPCKNLQFVVLSLDSGDRQSLEGQGLDSTSRCAHRTPNISTSHDGQRSSGGRTDGFADGFRTQQFTNGGDMQGEFGADNHKKQALRWKLKALSLRQKVVAGNLPSAGRPGLSPPCSLPSCQARPGISPVPIAATPASSRSGPAVKYPPSALQIAQYDSSLQLFGEEQVSGETAQVKKPQLVTETTIMSATANEIIQENNQSQDSDDGVTVHQREWISIDELKTLLRERLTELASKVGSGSQNKASFEGSQGEARLTPVEQEGNIEGDGVRDGGAYGCENSHGSDWCNAAQILQDILKSRQVADDELESYGEKLPSLGALLHEEGLCKPCVFANKANKQCLNGVACLFCHHFHKEKRKRARKARSQQKHQSSPGGFSPVSMLYPDSHHFAPLLHPATAHRSNGLCKQIPGRSPMTPILRTPVFSGCRSTGAKLTPIVGNTGSLPALLPGGGGSAQFRATCGSMNQPPPPPPPPPGLEKLAATDVHNWKMKGQIPINVPKKFDSELCPTLLTGGRSLQSIGSAPRQLHAGGRREATSPPGCSSGAPGCLQSGNSHAKMSTTETRHFLESRIPGTNSSTHRAATAIAKGATRDPSYQFPVTDRTRMNSIRAQPSRRVNLQHKNHDSEYCLKRSQDSAALRPPGGKEEEAFDNLWLQDRNCFVLKGMLNEPNLPQNTAIEEGCNHDSLPNKNEFATDGNGSDSQGAVSSLRIAAAVPLENQTESMSWLNGNEKQESERVWPHPPMMGDGEKAIDDLAKRALGRLNRDELVHLMDLIACTLATQSLPVSAGLEWHAHQAGEHFDTPEGSSTPRKLDPILAEAGGQEDGESASTTFSFPDGFARC